MTGPTPMRETLQVCEVFSSFQGETTSTGWGCFFIRLAGCNLRCRYCDTPYAWTGGQTITITKLVRAFEASGMKLAAVTGGEPLLQPGVVGLLERLSRRAETILETNGSLPLPRLPRGVRVILDLKCPGSGHVGSNVWNNLDSLRPMDEVKFVLCGRRDYLWARKVTRQRLLIGRCRAVNFSPAGGFLKLRVLADWILRDRLPVRLNLQIHKQIWPEAVRGK